MKITTKEMQLCAENGWYVGPTFAYCNNPDRPDYGSLIMNTSIFNGSDSGVGNLMFRSYDEGETWTEEGFIEKSFMSDRFGSMNKVGGNDALYADNEAGVILFTSNEMHWNRNKFSSTKQCGRQFYRLSFDNGHTWTDKKYIVMDGMTFDNPIPDVVYGRNFALSMASQTLRADDGSLMVALQCQMVDENGKLIEPAGFHFFQCGAMHAKWDEELQEYKWTMSEYVQVTPEESMRGVFEPTFGRLGDNRFIMVMRNSNHKNPNVIGQKFYSVSDDNGYHWSRPKPLTYDDGSTMYSSSCVPKLFAHSNGKLYYIGIINSENPDSNSPRYPLCIAELDRESCTIVKDSVTVIDTKRGNQASYSNHGIYEDSQKRIIVYTPFNSSDKRGLSRYVIEL
nr:exo-alpha-sialidase [Clostridia bacterium]